MQKQCLTLFFFFFNCLNFPTFKLLSEQAHFKRENLKSSGMYLIPNAGTTQAIGKSPTYFNGNVI